MLSYLVILLDNTSLSYCHCDNPHTERMLMPLDALKEAIFFAMKQNLMIQFVYPDYQLPQAYYDLIDTIDHHDFVPVGMQGDVIIADISRDNVDLSDTQLDDAKTLVVRVNKSFLFNNEAVILALAKSVRRINVVVTDVNSFVDDDYPRYSRFLDSLVDVYRDMVEDGTIPICNLVTTRLMIEGHNSCNAGVDNLTVAPDGRFYICPAFFYSNPDSAVGTLPEFPNILNQRLFRFDHAPICQRCDAYQCRRCVWLNKLTTREVNTPSRQQCIVAHLERNASRKLLYALRDKKIETFGTDIPPVNYLDPLDHSGSEYIIE